MVGSMIALMAAAMVAASDAPATPPPADADSAAPAKPVKKPKDPLDKIVCRDIQVTGSHLGGEEVCKPQRYWNALTEHGHQVLQDAQRLNSGMKPFGG